MELRLTLKADLGEAIAGHVPVAQSVGPRGEAALLLVSEADRAVALVHDGERGSRVDLQDLDVAWPFLQPLPGGEFLVVGARCRRFPDGSAERNGRLYGPDGAPRRELLLGDGIADVQARSADDIWVSYRDEGVFGNYGWRHSATDAPVGAAGLVRFDAGGNKRWEYTGAGGFGAIADCYALNVADRDTWACYYTDFPLVRIDPSGAARGWQTDVAGARALATDGRRVLLVGGYPPHRERCVLAELGETALARARELRVALPSNATPSADRIIGRGPILHVFTGGQWWQADLRRLP